MTPPVFAVPASALADVGAEDVVRVSGAEGHHAVAVRRIGDGEPVTLTDGAGASAHGVVAGIIDRSTFDVRVTAITRDPEPQPRLIVVQALPKGDRGELAVELLTEVGVDVIVPWAAARCVTRWRADRVEKAHRKWVDAAVAAGKQSRRTRFPVVAPLTDTTAVVAAVAAADLALVLDESADESIAAHRLPDHGDVLLVVGPEGGLADDELESLTAAGASCVRLGPSVLRTSSAGMAAAAALLAPSPRWAPAPSAGMGG